MLNEKHNKIQVALLSTSTRRVMLPMIIEVIKKLRTKSPNIILTQHACKESLVYTVNNGKQPKKKMLCNYCIFFIYFPCLQGKTKRRREGSTFLVLPHGMSYIYDSRFSFCFQSYNAVTKKHVLHSCKLNSLFSKLNDFCFLALLCYFERGIGVIPNKFINGEITFF